ncbi:peptidylprolyl isomerase [Frankia sp. CcI49]|uniref:peptidylprolyl isomerase n=1 Tax=unclassified Frankia TaxID=2632575 RepID=UPI0006CA2865|nr:MULTISPECIES: peptidylprolyl isomerase [unclassified Frankia]KPM55567.1 peptidylprolyl isomerase [Frankia sp. R43]ONH62245.1 peptidylprolyl isomerase [Frankia sp. CcI49]
MSSTRERRQRELAAARAARQAQRRREAHLRQRKRVTVIAAVVVVAIVGSVIASVLLSGGSDDNNEITSTSPSATQTATTPTTSALPAGQTSKVGDCVYTSTGEAPSRQVSLPTAAATVNKNPATMVITTDQGTITAALDADKAPCTVNALRSLAEAGFYTDTACHRQTGGADAGISVLQCGDPTATGTGGPGFGYANENTEGVNYNRGVLAMAHSSQPDSNGSQFFINYADPTADGASALAGGYTVFGHITEGLDVLDKLTSPGIEGGGSDGTPASKAQIKSIEINQEQ